MGMFDSLWIKKHDDIFDVQTKDFACILDNVSWLEKIEFPQYWEKNNDSFFIYSYDDNDKYGSFYISFVFLHGYLVDYCIYKNREEEHFIREKLNCIWQEKDLQNLLLSYILKRTESKKNFFKTSNYKALSLISNYLTVSINKDKLNEELESGLYWSNNKFINSGTTVVEDPLKHLSTMIVASDTIENKFTDMAVNQGLLLDYEEAIELSYFKHQNNCDDVYTSAFDAIRDYCLKNIEQNPDLIYSTIMRKSADAHVVNKFEQIKHIDVGQNSYINYADFLVTTKPSLKEMKLLNGFEQVYLRHLDLFIFEKSCMNFLENAEIKNKALLIMESFICVFKSVSDNYELLKQLEVFVEYIEKKIITDKEFYRGRNCFGLLLDVMISSDIVVNDRGLELIQKCDVFYTTPDEQNNKIAQLSQCDNKVLKQIGISLEQKYLNEKVKNNAQHKKVNKI